MNRTKTELLPNMEGECKLTIKGTEIERISKFDYLRQIQSF